MKRCGIIFTLIFSVISLPTWAYTIPSSLSFDELPSLTGTQAFQYNVDLKAWGTFAAKLEDCRATQLNLPNPVQIAFLKMAVNLAGGKKMNGSQYTQADIDELIKNSYQDYTIQGWKQDKCNVIIEAKKRSSKQPYVSGYHLDDEFVKEIFPITKVKCVFEKKDLPVLSKSAREMQKEEEKEVKIDEVVGDILVKACQPIKD